LDRDEREGSGLRRFAVDEDGWLGGVNMVVCVLTTTLAVSVDLRLTLTSLDMSVQNTRPR